MNAHYTANTEVARDGYMSDTADALANLDTETASDCGAVAQLTDTNAKLVETNSKLTTQIVTLTKEVELLRKNAKIANAKQNSGAPRQFKGTHAYCWSHGAGLGIRGNHNIQTCPDKKEGHVNRATFYNQNGGSKDGIE